MNGLVPKIPTRKLASLVTSYFCVVHGSKKTPFSKASKFCRNTLNLVHFSDSQKQNKRLNRIAIFSVNLEHKKTIERTANHFYKNPILTKNISMETLSKEFKPITLEKHEFENPKNRNNNQAILPVPPTKIPI